MRIGIGNFSGAKILKLEKHVFKTNGLWVRGERAHQVFHPNSLRIYFSFLFSFGSLTMNRFGIYFAEMKKKRDREKKQFAISSLEINRKIHFEMKHDVAEKFVERCFSFGKRV